MMKKILVAGGAGYIGSCMVRRLADEGYPVVVFDNLSMGHRDMVDRRAVFAKGDLRRPEDLKKLFKKHRFDAVMHFAAAAFVGESVADPMKYYDNNVLACWHLLDAMRRAKVKKFIFSSTCATYGEPVRLPISESHPQSPANPYGRSKLAIEWMLRDLAAASDFKYISLRYFNACGAHSSGDIGEKHTPETHIIPNVLRAAKTGRKFTIFGGDFDTPDGTCIRDYIHIEDLTEAHLLALKNLGKTAKNEAFNLSTSLGYSNLEILKTAEKVTGRKIAYRIGPRRPGDPSRLVGSASKAKRVLGWTPKRDLEEMMRSAWEWEQRS